jgi:hypothetical protein
MGDFRCRLDPPFGCVLPRETLARSRTFAAC